MGEAYGTVVAVILAVYLMFIAPLNNMLDRNGKLEQMYIVNEITYFVEQVRNTGCIDEAMYITLEKRLASLSGIYKIDITHYKNIYGEDESEVLYFESEEYLWHIKECLDEAGIYHFRKNEYIKVTVKSGDSMVACYGGSIKNESDGF